MELTPKDERIICGIALHIHTRQQKEEANRLTPMGVLARRLCTGRKITKIAAAVLAKRTHSVGPTKTT